MLEWQNATEDETASGDKNKLTSQAKVKSMLADERTPRPRSDVSTSKLNPKGLSEAGCMACSEAVERLRRLSG